MKRTFVFLRVDKANLSPSCATGPQATGQNDLVMDQNLQSVHFCEDQKNPYNRQLRVAWPSAKVTGQVGSDLQLDPIIKPRYRTWMTFLIPEVQQVFF